MGSRGPTPLTEGLDGLPIVKPPYGVISAIDLHQGTLKFRVPHGDTPDAVRNNPTLKGVSIPKTGQQGIVGIVVTKTLVTIGNISGVSVNITPLLRPCPPLARLLHSHEVDYRHHGSSGQQQVAGFAGYDDKDLWRLKGAHGTPEGFRSGEPIRDWTSFASNTSTLAATYTGRQAGCPLRLPISRRSPANRVWAMATMIGESRSPPVASGRPPRQCG